MALVKIPLLPKVSTVNWTFGQRALARFQHMETGLHDPNGNQSEIDLAGDVFADLYRAALPLDPAPADREINARLLEFARKQAGWESMANDTRFNAPAALAASEAFWTKLVTDEAFSKALDAEEEAAEAEQEAQAAETLAEALEDMCDEEKNPQPAEDGMPMLPGAEGDPAEGEGQPTDGEGEGQGEPAEGQGQGQASASMMAMAAQARQQADALRAEANEKRAMAVDLMDRIEANQTNRAVMSAAVREAAEKAEEVSEMFGGFGSERGALGQMDIQEAQRLMAKMTPKLRKIAEMAGRFRNAAFSARKSRVAEGVTPKSVELTKDWDRIFPAELALLHPDAGDLRYFQGYNYAETGLAGWEVGGEGKERGPFVAAVDVSGSMAGKREMVAKAICLGVAQVAKRERRPYRLFLFSSRSDRTIHCSSGDDLETHLRWAEMTINGGTSFELALNMSMKLLGEMGEDGESADVLFISDGEATVDDKTAGEWKAFSEKTGARLLYVPVAKSYYSDIENLADKVIAVRELDADAGAGVASDVAVFI